MMDALWKLQTPRVITNREGTESELTNKTFGKIPILGDIPWLGALFRSQSKKMLKEELLFMITPRIIKDSEDVAELQLRK